MPLFPALTPINRIPDEKAQILSCVIHVTRFHVSNGECTLGRLKIHTNIQATAPETVFECATLELEYQKNEPCISCIPPGGYPILYRDYGDYWTTYNRRWGHEHVLEIDNVPNRSAILIHTGNNPDHTKGCILVGRHHNIPENQVVQSRLAYVDFMEAVKKYKPEAIIIEYKDDEENK